jgi:hypothetical protein
MIIIVARPAAWPGVALASDADPLHNRQKYDHDRGCRDAHVSDIEDRPIRQLEEVDHVAAEHSWWAKQPICQVSCDAGAQQSNSHGPGRMADSRNQLDDHEGKHHDPRDGKHVSKTLTLAERSAGVSNEPQREQSTQQPDRSKRFELGNSDDLGDHIGRQPSNGD